MKCFLENSVAAAAGLRRVLGIIAFLIAALFLSAEKVRSQTTVGDDLVVEMAEQQKLISTFRTLDYRIREHFLLEANAILSTYGGWNSVDRLGNDAYRLRDSTAEFERQAVVIKRDVGRSKAINEEELQRFNDALESYSELIKTGDQIAKAIDDGRVGDANQIYFEIARPNYMQVHGTLYTLITTAERRVAALARAARN